MLDLSRIEFIDTTGLATLLELRSTLQGRGVLFEIDAADGPVRHAVNVTGDSATCWRVSAYAGMGRQRGSSP